MARTDRRSFLVIGSLKLLGTFVPVNLFSGMNSDHPFQVTLGRIHEVFFVMS
jgi:hypothetical protein